MFNADHQFDPVCIVGDTDLYLHPSASAQVIGPIYKEDFLLRFPVKPYLVFHVIAIVISQYLNIKGEDYISESRYVDIRPFNGFEAGRTTVAVKILNPPEIIPFTWADAPKCGVKIPGVTLGGAGRR